MTNILSRAGGKLKARYDKAQAQKKKYEDIERRAKEIEERKRDETYESARLKRAESDGATRGKAMAQGRGNSGGLRQGAINFMGNLSEGSANALKSGMFDMGGNKTFGGLEDVTGMTGDSGMTLKEIEIATGVSKRKPKVDPELRRGRSGTNITINMAGQKSAKRLAAKQQKRQRDWQDDISDLTGF